MDTLATVLAVKRKQKEEVKKEDLKGKVSTTIDILDAELHRKMVEEAKRKGKTLRRWSNDIFEMHFEKQEFLDENIPLKEIAFKNGFYFVFDEDKGITAQIGMKSNFVHCDYCKSPECAHAVFALALPEVSRLEPLRDK